MKMETGMNTENAEKTFTQNEVNKIVADRLARARKNEGALSEMLLRMRDDGLIEGENTRELAESLYRKLTAKASERTAPEQGVPEQGVPEQGASGQTVPETTEVPQNVGEMREQISAFMREYPSADVRSVLSDREFMSFYAGILRETPEMTLSGAFGEYVGALARERERAAASKRLEKSLKSTPSSGKAVRQADYGLSERQKSIAREAGMSYGEYHGLLSQISSGRKR